MANLREQPWHASSILGPYRFFDVKGIQTKQAHGHSFINVPELNAAIALYQRLKQDYRNIDFTGKIGIITTYKAQLNELKSRFERKFGEKIFDEIEFNTTDAFQGREREIIIFSCVRAKATGGIGFLGDIRRMNVGLTRAKSSLWVLGDSNALQQGEFWNRLIQDSQERNRYTGGDVMALLSKPTSRDQLPREAPQPGVNGYQRPSTSLESTAASSTATMPGHTRNDPDIEMIDAPSMPGSRKSSTSGSSSSNETISYGNRPRDPSVKQGSRRTSIGGSSRDSSVIQESRKSTPNPGASVKQEDRKLAKPGSAMGLNLQGKRPLESLKDEEVPVKKEKVSYTRIIWDNES
jgi:senataxin